MKDSKTSRPRLIDLTFNTVVPYCLVYLKSQGKVLLIRKAPGRVYEGQWIGLGGKLEPGEDTGVFGYSGVQGRIRTDASKPKTPRDFHLDR